MLFRPFLSPLVFIEIVTERPKLSNLAVEQRFKGFLILLIAHPSDDRVPPRHEVLEVLVDELDREQVLEVVDCTMFDVRAEALVNHQKNLASPRVAFFLCFLLFENVDLSREVALQDVRQCRCQLCVKMNKHS